MSRNTARIIRALLLGAVLFWQGTLLAAHDAWQHADFSDHPECEVCALLAGGAKATGSAAVEHLPPTPHTHSPETQNFSAPRPDFIGASPRAPPA